MVTHVIPPPTVRGPHETAIVARLALAHRIVSYLRETVPCQHPPSPTCSYSRPCRLLSQWDALEGR